MHYVVFVVSIVAAVLVGALFSTGIKRFVVNCATEVKTEYEQDKAALTADFEKEKAALTADLATAKTKLTLAEQQVATLTSLLKTPAPTPAPATA